MFEPSIVVIDGEHYPPVIKRAIARLRDRGEDPILALLVGGGEKLDQVPLEIGVPVTNAIGPPGTREKALAEALSQTGAKRVIDLSDEPVLGYVERCRLASVALWKGATYVGADFAFEPPPRSLRPNVPAVGVIGTGKRTGKTAIASEVAQVFLSEGSNPVVIAMGRGGPEDPEVIEAGMDLTPSVLDEWASSGRHAASDYIEDALTARVPTVGTWRAGGGLVGATSFDNYEEALRAAEKLSPGILILEGSGAAIPPSQWDAGILVVSAKSDPSLLCGYFGLYRLLLTDLVVLTMAEETADRREIRTRRMQLAPIESCIRSRPLGESKIVHTVFRPHPLGDISGKKVWFSTTADPSAGEVLIRHLEEAYGAEVAGISHSLSDRATLRKELVEIPDVDAILVELKAAAVDVVTRFGLEKGIEVVYAHNQPITVGGDADLKDLVEETADLARTRFLAGVRQ